MTRISIIGAVVTTLSAFAVAQDDPKGLDALSDDRLLTELSKRNLQGLLKYAFDKNNVPQAKQNAVKAGAALARLSSDKGGGLNEKRKLVAEFVNALPQLLPQMNEPTSLMTDANILIQHGVLTDQRLLEYFGTNSTIMSRLQPVTDGVQKMLAKARDQAAKAAEKAANNWPAGRAAWERFDQLATTGEYTRNIINYSSAIALDKASEERPKYINEGLEYLSAFDTEENPNRADVKFYISKLNMALASKESLDAARAGFKFVIENGDTSNVGQQFDARFLTVVTEINAKDATAAQTQLAVLETWVKQQKIDSPELKVALAALKYRILLVQADAASGAEKDKLAQAADDVLNQLQLDQPTLRGLILELMGARVKPDAPVASLNVLLLQSLRAKGEAETIKPEGAAFDKSSVERGLDASREIIKRGGKENEQVVQDSRYVNGFFLQKLGQKEESAAAFLDYVDNYKGKTEDGDRVTTALNNAIAIVGQLYREKMGDTQVRKLYDRVLETAVEKPFERPEFLFEAARSRQATGNLDGAIALFDKIPTTDKQHDEGRYFKMVAVRSKLDKLKSNAPERAALMTELQKLADQVTAAYDKRLADADPELAKRIRMRLSQTRLVAADVALVDQKDPKRAIELLKGFEETVKGLSTEANLISQVLLIRVKAFVQTNQVAEGVKEIQKLAVERPKEAMQIIFDLMDKLNDQVTEAEGAGRTEDVANLERTRAELTPVLVKLINESQNEELKKFSYTISLYDADQQRRAAELTKEGPQRTELLQAAVKRFEQLDSKEQLAKYMETLDPERKKKSYYDPQVKLGLARANFALGNWDASRQALALLFRDKVLGDGFVVKIGPDGTPDSVENPTYWEAVLMLMRSNVAMNEGMEGMKRWLVDLTNTWQDGIGGQRWGGEFKKLQKELGVEPVTSKPEPAK